MSAPFLLKFWRSWFLLSLHDIRIKYRRAFLGPLWLVFGVLLSLLTLASVWSLLFNLNWKIYLPYYMTGMITWYWLSSYITQAPEIFIGEFQQTIISTRTSFNLIILRFIMRGFWIFIHYLPVWFMSCVITNSWPQITHMLLAVLAMPFILLSSYGVVTILSYLGTRYRDVSPAVAAIMTPMMLLTPIMWQPDMIGEYSKYVFLNPFFHYISVVRDPLVGSIPSLLSYIFVSSCSFLLFFVARLIHGNFKNKLIFWL